MSGVRRVEVEAEEEIPEPLLGPTKVRVTQRKVCVSEVRQFQKLEKLV